MENNNVSDLPGNCVCVVRPDGSISEIIPNWNAHLLSESEYSELPKGWRLIGGFDYNLEAKVRDAEKLMAHAWQSISNVLPEFYFTFLWQVIHEAITDKTTTVNLSKSVCELALYIDLTGTVPDDPFVFFDFNK